MGTFLIRKFWILSSEKIHNKSHWKDYDGGILKDFEHYYALHVYIAKYLRQFIALKLYSYIYKINTYIKKYLNGLTKSTKTLLINNFAIFAPTIINKLY